jgi:hypothetical protein
VDVKKNMEKKDISPWKTGVKGRIQGEENLEKP